MGRVDDKVIVVTGGASGIGEADCLMLAGEGATVVVADLDEQAGSEVAKKCGGKSCFVALDVAEEDDWRRLVADVEHRLGALHVLVNNAGIVIPGSIVDATMEDYRRIMAVNVDGVFLGCKHAIPAMERSGGGSIINMSSLAGISGTPPYAAYSASKGAVRALTLTVAAHCRSAKNGVRCNSIHPAGIGTPMIRNMVADAVKAGGASAQDAANAAAAATQPGADMGSPEDVAAMVLYLASDESKFVSGAAMVIDNGTLSGGVPGPG